MTLFGGTSWLSLKSLGLDAEMHIWNGREL